MLQTRDSRRSLGSGRTSDGARQHPGAKLFSGDQRRGWVKVGGGDRTNTQPHTLKGLGSSEKGARGTLGTQQAPGPVQHSRTHTDTGKGAPGASHADSRRQSQSSPGHSCRAERQTSGSPVGSLGGARVSPSSGSRLGGGVGPERGAAPAGAGRAGAALIAPCSS